VIREPARANWRTPPRRLFLSVVVDARSEASDLLWRFDAVARLADAHLAAVRGSTVPADLNAARYIEPGALWWAFDWAGAAAQLAAARLRHRARNAGRRVDAGAARCC